MKAMILAAGRGERMRPLSDTLPKPLLEVAGKPLIVYHIERLVRAGVNELVINHAWLGEKIERALGNGSAFHARIHYSEERHALETAGGIKQALPLLGADEFLLVNGDIWCDFDFTALLTQPLNGDLGRLILVDNPPHKIEGDFILTNDRVKRGVSGNPNSLTYAGIARFSPALFSELSERKAPLLPLLNAAIDKNLLAGLYYSGDWLDVGTAARLQELRDRIESAHN
ncbi:MAG: N-acetylmuramate alpha-1-phosphate uridylyltransferase MurU [Pseudomonadales bacterium]